jgi:hypothetical protein
MKKLILMLFAFLPLALFAQENNAYWSAHLGSHFYSKNTWNFYYENPLGNDYRRLLNTSTQLFIGQPSFRKYNGSFFTEFGLRNTGFSSGSTYRAFIENGLDLIENVTIRQQNASFGLYFGKSAKLIWLGKLEIWLGGDINSTINFSNADFNSAKHYNDGFEIRETSLTTGVSLTPRMQYNLGKRCIIDLALNIQTISYSFISEQTRYNDVLLIQNQNSNLFSMGFAGSPQLSFGIKI